MEMPEQELEQEPEKKIQHYEMLYIVPVKYTVEEMPAIKAKIAQLLAEHGCEITFEEDLGKRKLAYPIKNVYHGYYWVVEFNLTTDQLAELDHSLKLMPEVLRHLIIVKRQRTNEEISIDAARRARVEAEELAKLKDKIKGPESSAAVAGKVKVEAAQEKAKTNAKNKVSLEDLDKKLDELIDSSIL